MRRAFGELKHHGVEPPAAVERALAGVERWFAGGDVSNDELQRLGDAALAEDAMHLHTSARKMLLATRSLCLAAMHGDEWEESDANVLKRATDVLAYLLDESLSDDELVELEEAQAAEMAKLHADALK